MCGIANETGNVRVRYRKLFKKKAEKIVSKIIINIKNQIITHDRKAKA